MSDDFRRIALVTCLIRATGIISFAMRTSVLCLFTLLIAGSPTSPAQDNSCLKARTNLELFIGRLDRTCRVDSDCTGAYIRADSCKSAAILNKRALSQTANIEKVQVAVLESCKKELSQQPVCSPIPYTAECFEAKCRERRPDNSKASSVHEPYTYVYQDVRCTGNDWIVTKLYLTARPQGCGVIKGELLEFNIIPETEHVEHPAGGGPPELLIKVDLNGTIFFGPKKTRLDAAAQAKKWDAHFGDAYRCSPPNFSTCVAATSGQLVIDNATKGDVRGHYELHFPDGSMETGTFTNPQPPCDKRPVQVCG